MSKLLIISTIFIKCIIYPLLPQKHLLVIIRKGYKDHKGEGKLVELYSKKLLITLTAFYETLN